MNNEMLSLLQNAMLRELGKAIKQHNPDFAVESCTADTVFANIESIYDEIPEKEFGEPTGRVMKFMPKRYKEMIMRLISPECAFSYKRNESDFSMSIEAFLFLNREDTKPVSSGTATVLYSSIDDSNMDDFAKKRYAETIARGLAESKALQKFGIGSWFHYEMEEENPEVMLDQVKQKTDLVPTLPPVSSDLSDRSEADPVTEPNDEKGKKNRKKVEKADKVTSPTEKSVEITQPVKEEPVQQNDSNMGDVASARKTICTIGKANGMTLGEIEEKYAANLVWQYTQSECTYKDDLRVIILNNPDLSNYAKERGVEL